MSRRQRWEGGKLEIKVLSFSLLILNQILFSFDEQLTPLEIRSSVDSVLQGSEADTPIVSESECMVASDVIRQHSGYHGCIAFAVRRPGEFSRYSDACHRASSWFFISQLYIIFVRVARAGWILCREEGRAIAYLAAREDKPLEGFGIFGVVKEIGVDDAGMLQNCHKMRFIFSWCTELKSSALSRHRFGGVPEAIFPISTVPWWRVSWDRRRQTDDSF